VTRHDPAARPSPRKRAARPAQVQPPTTLSSTGVELVDGSPFFALVDGVRMNRRQWLDATREQRKAIIVAQLRAQAEGMD
jgi:hypothetical protein